MLESWKSSHRPGFTHPTFTAWIQTLRGVAGLCEDLLGICDFQYVLTGKLLSDPLEARFGCYRQMSGANYLLSVKQLFDSEKKLRVLNKLADLQRALDNDFNVTQEFQPLAVPETPLRNVLTDDLREAGSAEDVPREDQNIVFYVSGYIGRSISKANHCEMCKKILIADQTVSIDTEPNTSDTPDIAESDRRILFDLANRGALSAPTEYCFHICLTVYQYFLQVFNCHHLTKTFLACEEHENTFFGSSYCEDDDPKRNFFPNQRTNMLSRTQFQETDFSEGVPLFHKEFLETCQ